MVENCQRVRTGKSNQWTMVRLMAVAILIQMLNLERVNGKLVSLDKETLRKLKGESKYLIVGFTAKWCNHCKGLERILEEVEQKVQLSVAHGHSVTFGTFNCENRYEYCHETESIPGYPTVRLYYRNQYVNYRRHLTTDELSLWIDDRVNHALEELSGS